MGKCSCLWYLSVQLFRCDSGGCMVFCQGKLLAIFWVTTAAPRGSSHYVVQAFLVFVCFLCYLGVLATADFRKWREEIFLLQFLTREWRNKGNQGKCCQKAKAGTMFLGFLCLITCRDDALHWMGVQVDYLSNGPGALYFLRCIILWKDVLTESSFLYLGYSSSSDKRQVSVAQDLLLFLIFCFSL